MKFLACTVLKGERFLEFGSFFRSGECGGIRGHPGEKAHEGYVRSQSFQQVYCSCQNILCRMQIFCNIYRSWDRMYCLLTGAQLALYKDQKHRVMPLYLDWMLIYLCFFLQEEGVYLHGEAPLQLTGSTVEIAAGYKKKTHVFSLTLPNGAEYLFQTRDDVRFFCQNACAFHCCFLLLSG